MQTFGVIANGQAVPNVTVTTYADVKDHIETFGICNRKSIEGDAKVGQVLSSVTTKNFRRRMAAQGAEETRFFPV